MSPTNGAAPVLAQGGALPLNGWVTVHLIDGSAHSGVLHSIDPESGTVVLLRPTPGEGADVVAPLAVFAHALSSIESHGPPAEAEASDSAGVASLEPLRSDLQSGLDAAGVAARREAVCALLRRQRVPFEPSAAGSDELVVLGCLRVTSPYDARSCHCENETVLGRFLALLELLDAAEGG